MSEEAGERTEAPSQKRLRDAADKGDVLKSRELATALAMLAGVSWITFLGPRLVAACREVMAASFRFGRADVEDFSPLRPLIQAGWRLLLPLGTLLALAVAAALLSQGLLGGLRWNGKLMAPKGSRVDPAAGLARVFGTNGWVELGKSLLKVALLGSVGGWMLWRAARPSFGLASSNLEVALGGLAGMLDGVLFAVALGLAGIAGLDVPVAAWRRLSKLRMTKQEVRDEHKEAEGSPEAKAHRRQRQRDMARGGARMAVAEAQVVLTNPTHFAVALRYERGRDQVPVVVAKGRGATALAIRGIAGELAVPVLEYPQLARAVYFTSREGQEVRDDLYHAVATVLAFVFGLNAAAGGTAQPPVDVPPAARFDEDGRPA